MSKKYTVQLVQLNNRYGQQVYLPYSVGVLESFVKLNKEIKDNFDFKEFIFLRENISSMVDKIGDVNILGISCYVWNWRISLKLAEKVREKNPNCMIFLGGPHVPDKIDESFFKTNPYIDLLMHGEGALTFEETLIAYLHEKPLNNILSTSFFDRKNSNKVYFNKKRERMSDYSILPSPYLEGTFENILNKYDYKWMVTWETNRGCPFKCTFCDWGSATASKLRKFEEKRLYDEIDYFTKKKVDLIFGADANFGILKRDMDLALKLAENKKKYGFPNQFRVCFTKNSTEQVFQLARIFAEAGMSKGVSVSMQSLNKDTLKNIKRDNIKMDFFKSLQQKYVKADLVTYTELILPLPGETYDSFKEGVDNLLDSSQHSGLIVYNATVMPNAELGDKNYQDEHKIETVTVPVFQAHSDKQSDEIIEYESVVVGTYSMSRSEWKKTYKFAMLLQAFHVLGLLQAISIILRHEYGITYSRLFESILEYGERNQNSFIKKELDNIEKLLDGVLKGGGFDQYVDGFEKITWPPEEAMFLRTIENFDLFYNEINSILISEIPKLKEDKAFLHDLIEYQKKLVVHYKDSKETKVELKYNIHEYFNDLRAGKISQLKSGKFTYSFVTRKDYSNSKKLFSREVLWYGRKGGKFFHPVKNLSSSASLSN